MLLYIYAKNILIIFGKIFDEQKINCVIIF